MNEKSLFLERKLNFVQYFGTFVLEHQLIWIEDEKLLFGT